MKAAPCILMLASVLSLSGCAAQNRMYNWGRYDPAMYAYYKTPAKLDEFEGALREIMVPPSGGQQKPVPPGIYAEYGYLLLQQGKASDAVEYFRQEVAHWPESNVLMQRMIAVAGAPSSKPPGANPASEAKP